MPKSFGMALLCGLFCTMLLLQAALQFDAISPITGKNQLGTPSPRARLACARCEENATFFEDQVKSLEKTPGIQTRRRAENNLHAIIPEVLLGCASLDDSTCRFLRDGGLSSAKLLTHSISQRAGPILS